MPKALNRVDVPTRERIIAAIYNLPSGDIKKLKGYTAAFRLRAGTWRVLFEMTVNELKVNAVLPRGDAYK